MCPKNKYSRQKKFQKEYESDKRKHTSEDDVVPVVQVAALAVARTTHLDRKELGALEAIELLLVLLARAPLLLEATVLPGLLEGLLELEQVLFALELRSGQLVAPCGRGQRLVRVISERRICELIGVRYRFVTATVGVTACD